MDKHIVHMKDEELSDKHHEDTIKFLQEENRFLSKEVIELKKKNETLKSLWNGAQQEIGYYKENNRAIKASFSYRFGNLFAESVKSPRKLVFLPISMVEFLASGVWKKIVFHYKKSRATNSIGKEKYKKTEGFKNYEDGALRALINKVSDEDMNKLASYLISFEPTGYWVALVSEGEVSPPKALQLSGDTQQVHPNTWFSLFKNSPPYRVVIDHEAVARGGKWASCIEGGAYGYPYHLVEMLSYCSSHSIDIVLWKRSEGQSSLVSDFSSFISKVYVSDE
ncbi:hypothetical protein IEI94_10250 [Halomonas sp. ML-15]|uniref:hypothetical protein n=1 Tax=Halomonas sp. ML-15 TaxID=2773305 RepID=UPI0017478048|nr:hypothetical protein [Halomonas sp. ML-15]MBD3896230.1 hypothetical protein [Halomonas sp. ML-15]